LTMTGHLSDERLLDAVEGIVDAEERVHLETCSECRARRDEAKTALLLAREAEVPEPSPLYWEAFRRQVGRRIQEERPVGRPWLLPLAAAAAGLLFVLPLFRDMPPPASGPGAPVLPSWSALPPVEEDEDLALVAETGLEETDLAAVGEMKGLDEVLGDFSDEEQAAVGTLLGGRPAEEAL
jgi:hypothetical protein